ncbi:MAG: hypothetical protein LBT48_04910 [Prevotellaceae bacterium]|jgi:hypothetical protein|nr:hypothetical protein [Prevotellaceae bacterium]
MGKREVKYKWSKWLGRTFASRERVYNFIITLICTLIGTFVGAFLAFKTTQYFQNKADAKEQQQIEVRAQEDLRQHFEMLKEELKANNNLLRTNEKKYNTKVLFFLEYHRNGFEMLRISGVMRQIEDKKLLSDIWRVYANLEELKQAHAYYLNNLNNSKIGPEVQKKYNEVEIRIDSVVIRLDSLLQKVFPAEFHKINCIDP